MQRSQHISIKQAPQASAVWCVSYPLTSEGLASSVNLFARTQEDSQGG